MRLLKLCSAETLTLSHRWAAPGLSVSAMPWSAGMEVSPSGDCIILQKAVSFLAVVEAEPDSQGHESQVVAGLPG